MTAPPPPTWIKPEDWAEYQRWLAERPAAVRAVAEKYPGYCVWRIKTTGQHVVIRVIDEGEFAGITMRVQVTSALNPGRLLMEREVFGIKPEDLELVRVRTSAGDGVVPTDTPEYISWEGQN